MLMAIALGLGGGIVAGKFRSNGGVGKAWVSECKFPDVIGQVAKTPVTWGQFQKFTEGIQAGQRVKSPAAQFLLKGMEEKSKEWSPSAPVQGVNWLVAQQFCNWLTKTAGKEGSGEYFTLPSVNELPQDLKNPEWTSDFEPDIGEKKFIGFLVKSKSAQIPYPPIYSGVDFTFRVKLVKLAK